MKIAIIGGAGFIGSKLTPELIARGHDVTVIDLFWFGNNLPKEAKIIEKDANSLNEDDLKTFDTVIFLAGLSNDPMAEYSPSRNFHENGATPSFVAWIAKRAKVRRYIYGGTCSVYGFTVNELYDETREARSNYPYGLSKLIGEFGIRQLEDENFSTICFRQGTVCGYSPRTRFDLIVNTMFKAAVLDQKIIVNNPAIWRPILSINDAVQAYCNAVDAPEKVSGVFNIASENYTVGEVAKLVQEGVEKALGIKAEIETRDVQDFRNYKVTWEKAKAQLNFDPKFKVEEIVAEIASHRNEYGDFTNPTYYNIATFKELDKKAELHLAPA